MLWHLRIDPAPGLPDVVGSRVASEAIEIGLPGPWRVASSRGFLIEGPLTLGDVRRAAEAVLADPVAEAFAIRPCGQAEDGEGTVVHVLPKPGVTDPEAESALAILRELGFAVENVRTIHSHRVQGAP